MSSSGALARWLERHRSLVQKGVVGRRDAAGRIDVARKHLERAHRALADDDPDLALICADAAMVNAADAVIARDGYRLRGRTGSHEARFDYPGLPAEFAHRRRRMQQVRKLRSKALYEMTDVVPLGRAQEVLVMAGEMISAAERELTPRPHPRAAPPAGASPRASRSR